MLVNPSNANHELGRHTDDVTHACWSTPTEHIVALGVHNQTHDFHPKKKHLHIYTFNSAVISVSVSVSVSRFGGRIHGTEVKHRTHLTPQACPPSLHFRMNLRMPLAACDPLCRAQALPEG
jgi:hypothetical protein